MSQRGKFSEAYDWVAKCENNYANFSDVAINIISDALLAEILVYLPREELLKAALVSRRFNKVISNWARLLKIIPLQWTQYRNNEKHCRFKSSRKHQTIIWKCQVISAPFVYFMENQNESLKNIKIRLITKGQILRYHNLLDCIDVIKKYLQHISIEFVDSDMKRFNFEELQSLKLSGSLDGAPWWVRAIIVREEQMLINIAPNLKKGKELNRSRSFYDRYVAKKTQGGETFETHKQRIEEDMKSESFELHALCANNLRIDPHDIDAHISRDNLAMLSILHLSRMTIDETFIKRILGLNLRLVKLAECEICWDGHLEFSNSTIERFLFMKNKGERSNDLILEILECCNNVKYLEFLRTDLSPEIYEKIANIFTLTTLCLGSRRETLKAVTFPFITQLIIDDYGDHKINSIIELIQANKHLKTVTLLKCLEQNEKLKTAIEESNIFTRFKFVRDKISAIERYFFLFKGNAQNVL